MLQRILFVTSFGNRCYLAGYTYLAMSMVVLQSIPDSAPVVHASVGCPAGQICCDDGTSGSASTCCCCQENENSISTIACQ